MNLLLLFSFIYIFPQFVAPSNMLSDPLLVKIQQTKEDRKLDLLTEYIALELGYNSTDDNSMNGSSTEDYVKEVAEIVLYDYDLTSEQKMNALKVKHILEVFKTASLYEEHIERALELDDEATASHGKLNGSAHDRYVYEQHLVDILVLHEGHMATDLLIQSFAPNNIYAKRHVFGNESVNEINERETQSVRRATGTLNLVNKFFDPQYRLSIDVHEAAKLEHDDLYKRIENKAKENFEKILKLPNSIVEGTTRQIALPTETVSVTPPNIAVTSAQTPANIPTETAAFELPTTESVPPGEEIASSPVEEVETDTAPATETTEETPSSGEEPSPAVWADETDTTPFHEMIEDTTSFSEVTLATPE